MRLCFVCQEDIVRPQGGTGTYVRNITMVLAARGHDVHAIVRCVGNAAPLEIVNGVTVHRVNAPGPAVIYSPLFFRASRRKFLQLNADRIFDLVHGNMPLMSSWGIQGPRKPPVVETLHCTVREELRAISGSSLGRLNLNEVLARLLGPVWLHRERSSLRQARRVISVSQGLKQELIDQLGYPAQRVQVIPNGVDYQRFASTSKAESQGVRRSLGIDDKERVVLFLGRLMERKRAIDLVEALPRVLHDVPNARLVIVGRRNQNAQTIEHRTRELGIDARVTLINHVPYSEVPGYYGMADVYCLPSAYEGFPFTILEAMASGTPVVASRIKGIDEQITDGVTGQLHTVGSREEIAHCILRVLGDPDFAAATTSAAGVVVEQNYDWAVLGERTEAALQEAVA